MFQYFFAMFRQRWSKTDAKILPNHKHCRQMIMSMPLLLFRPVFDPYPEKKNKRTLTLRLIFWPRFVPYSIFLCTVCSSFTCHLLLTFPNLTLFRSMTFEQPLQFGPSPPQAWPRPDFWKLGTWKSENLESKKYQRWKFSRSEYILPKMLARSGLVGEKKKENAPFGTISS